MASLDEGELQHLDPEGIAPFVCYLATDYAANINAQSFLVFGNQVSLVSQPRPLNAIYNPDGHWTMEGLAPLARDLLTKDIPTPAPVQAPRQ